MVEVESIVRQVASSVANRRHQGCGACCESVDSVRKIAICDARRCCWRHPSHPVGVLHIRSRRREQLANPSNIRGDVINGFLYRGCGPSSPAYEDQSNECVPCVCGHYSPEDSFEKWPLAAKRTLKSPVSRAPLFNIAGASGHWDRTCIMTR